MKLRYKVTVHCIPHPIWALGLHNGQFSSLVPRISRQLDISLSAILNSRWRSNDRAPMATGQDAMGQFLRERPKIKLLDLQQLTKNTSRCCSSHQFEYWDNCLSTMKKHICIWRSLLPSFDPEHVLPLAVLSSIEPPKMRARHWVSCLTDS